MNSTRRARAGAVDHAETDQAHATSPNNTKQADPARAFRALTEPCPDQGGTA